MKITNVEITLRQIFDNIVNSAYDIITDGEGDTVNVEELVKCVGSRERLQKAFLNGYSVLMMGDVWPALELLDMNNVPYNIVVTNNEELFAVISSLDVNY
jgi:hypothetical protein